MHELGHALGLNHEDRYYNIMGEEWDCVGAYNGQVNFTAGEDACSGTVVMYGLDGGAAREDVGVTHWKYGSADSEGYSSHFRCGVYADDGSLVRAVPGTGAALGYGRSDPIFEVQKGRTIKVELTFENNGYSGSVSPRVSYYLSSDDTIDGSDPVLATPRPTLNRNTPYTRTQDLELPATLASGANYFILVHVDDLNEIAEVNGNNNKTYVRLRIK
jgi:hypothetical protein